MTTFEHDGLTLSYDDNERASGNAFVFVHGWCCNRSFFAPQYAHFGAQARCVALDLRGHGDSGLAKDGDYSIPTFAGDVAALIEELQLGPVVVVGHSMGGVIANALTAARPDLVVAAVLVDPAPLVVADAMRPIYEGLLAAIEGPDGAGARARLVDGMFMPTDDRSRRAEIAATMAAVPAEIAIPAMRGIFNFDSAAALASLSRPVCVIASDGPTNDAGALKATNAKLLHGQTLGAGHFNQFDAAAQVNAMIEDFLRKAATAP